MYTQSMKIRRGSRFYHPTWLDPRDMKSPMVVEVVAIRLGQVYYRQADATGRATLFQAIEVVQQTWRPA